MVRRPRAEAREKLRLSPPGTRGQCGPDSTRSKPSSLTWLPLPAVPNQAAVEGGWPTRGRCISLVGGCPNSFPDRARTTVLVTCPVACNPLVTPGSVANGGWELYLLARARPIEGARWHFCCYFIKTCTPKINCHVCITSTITQSITFSRIWIYTLPTFINK